MTPTSFHPTAARPRRWLPLVLAWLAALVLLDGAARAEAPSFARAPYLQMLGARSVMVSWRTAGTASGRLEIGRATPHERVLGSGGLRILHDVAVDALEPDTVYHYRVVLTSAAGETIATPTLSFRTAPEDLETPVRFAVFGDAGSGTISQMNVRDVIEDIEPRFLLVTGDLVYPAGAESTYQTRFFDVYAGILTRACVFPSPGNHDFLNDRTSYLDQFVLPTENPEGTERYYSFDFGAGHFVSLDSNDILSRPGRSPQLAWLRDDLARTEKPWKIVFFHHPLYSTGPHGAGPDKLPVRRALEPIFDEHEVDVCFTGHDHIYERTHPIRGGVVHDAWQGRVYRSPRGTVYIVTGGGGGGLYSRFGLADEIYSAHFAGIHHAVDVLMTGHSLAVRGRAADGAIFDSIVLRKDEARPTLRFLRGDVAPDDVVTLSDAVRALNYLFVGAAIDCPAAADWDANRVVDIVDPIAILQHLFLGAPPAPPPYPVCGTSALEPSDAFCVFTGCEPAP